MGNSPSHLIFVHPKYGMYTRSVVEVNEAPQARVDAYLGLTLSTTV